ncbi:MAG: Asp-tRNA(Asn)/Glu-tRNA(Gln) amidotransferase subunit GatB [Patescibacteria group bacterium]|nr:Asp-tRNA(Asn)/Glu-tRNA(Gln) amidotransferase subunit GatB [Patescibacteria group bacterium]
MQIKRVIIGLEVHVELRTASKMFCSCSADHFGKEPNTQTCPVCLGLPGALPVPNKKAIEWTLLLGLALGGEIQSFSRFDRKNYFYPDLPKGYQISQYQQPFILGGKITLESGKDIRIERIHLEEDTGKLLHQVIADEPSTLIDYNRSGVALVEIVSQPDLSSSEEAKEYLEKIHQIVRYLGISDADMEKGSMRLEPNVNLEIEDQGQLYYTPIVELKNINSFRFAKKAMEYEIKRQLEIFQEKRIEKGKGNKQTRGWDEDKQMTVPQREKEEASDYRYFPEPDIPPFFFTEKELTAYRLQSTAIELPRAKKERFMSEYGLSDYQAGILTAEKEMAYYFEEVVKFGKVKNIGATETANVIINKRAKEGISPKELVDFIASTKQTITVSEEDIDKIIDALLAAHPEVVESYKKGKVAALGMIVGLIKKQAGAVVPIERIAGRIR